MATFLPEQQHRTNIFNAIVKSANYEQKQVIDYFVQGCSTNKPTDSCFDAIVQNRRSGLNTREMALNKFMLDEDELKEIPDVMFEGFQIDKWDNGKFDGFSTIGTDMKWRSGKYAITHLFFSATQVYVYKYSFNFYNNEKEERTVEYFYKDITNFSTSSQTVNVHKTNCLGEATVSSATNTQQFTLTVPGDKFVCETQMDIESSVQAMKTKLREMKNAEK